MSHPTPTPTKTDDETAQPAQGKASKLPEWASLTAVVTGISIYAFATSSFYVWGLADVLKKPLAVYFSPTDYLRITPAWTVPTLSIVGFAIIAYLCGMVAALTQGRSTTSKPSERPVLALALVLGILGTFTTLLFNSKWRGEQYARSGIPEAPLNVGNPFRVGDPGVPDRETATALYRKALLAGKLRGLKNGMLITPEYLKKNYRGFDLVCSGCREDGRPCHGDVILEVANS